MEVQNIEDIPCDENGIIILVIGGVKRRFVKDKFIAYLAKNIEIPKFKVPKVKDKTHKPRKQREKKEKAPKGPDMRGKANCVPVLAIFPDGKEIVYSSSYEAGTTLKIGKSAVSKVLTGVQKHVNNIKFKKAV